MSVFNNRVCCCCCCSIIFAFLWWNISIPMGVSSIGMTVPSTEGQCLEYRDAVNHVTVAGHSSLICVWFRCVCVLLSTTTNCQISFFSPLIVTVNPVLALSFSITCTVRCMKLTFMLGNTQPEIFLSQQPAVTEWFPKPWILWHWQGNCIYADRSHQGWY